jgi:hypothetical protein
MRKCFILLIILSVAVQTKAQMEIKFLKGFKANATLSNLILKNPDTKSHFGTGVSFGNSEKLEIGKHFALQGDLLFHYKTFDIENISTPKTKNNIRAWEIEIPCYVVGQINVGSGKISVGAGSYFSYGLSAESNSGQLNLYRKDEITGKRPLNRWDYGFGTVFGYEFSNGLFINAAYRAEVSDWLNTNAHSIATKSQTFSLGLGYRFRLLFVKINKDKLLWKFF